MEFVRLSKRLSSQCEYLDERVGGEWAYFKNGLSEDSVVLKRFWPMREVFSWFDAVLASRVSCLSAVVFGGKLTVTTEYSCMNPFFDPAKRHKKASTRAAAEKTVVMIADFRIAR